MTYIVFVGVYLVYLLSFVSSVSWLVSVANVFVICSSDNKTNSHLPLALPVIPEVTLLGAFNPSNDQLFTRFYSFSGSSLVLVNLIVFTL